MRLDVMFATHPLSNSSRTFAMSADLLSTGTPTACTSFTALPTRWRMISRSWIIRSSTTLTSVPRGCRPSRGGGYGASRCASMNRGAAACCSRNPSTGLKRSTWPTCRIALCCRAAATRSCASSVVAAIGFSTSRCSPRASNPPATRWCRSVGTTMLAASISGAISSGEVKARVWNFAAISCARAGLESQTPTSSASGISE